MEIFSKDFIKSQLEKVGVKNNDIVYVHSDLLKSGLVKNNLSKLELKLSPELLFQALTSIIGESSVISVPAFTNSWGKGKVFSYTKSKINTGSFSEFICRQNGALRTNHGLLSVGIYGDRAAEFVGGNNMISAFGDDSIYKKLYQTNALLLMIGTDLCSFKDYVEVVSHVPYRYKKIFYGKIDDGVTIKSYQNIHHVRYMDNNINLITFLDAIGSSEKLKKASLDSKTNIYAIRSKDAYKILSNKLRANCYAFVNGDVRNKAAMEFLANIAKYIHFNHKVIEDFYACNNEDTEVWRLVLGEHYPLSKIQKNTEIDLGTIKYIEIKKNTKELVSLVSCYMQERNIDNKNLLTESVIFDFINFIIKNDLSVKFISAKQL